MNSEERKRKRKQKKRMGSNIDEKEMDEVNESLSDSESSGSDSSYDLCEDIDNVERNVVPAENMKSESVSEGMSSDYDLCDLDDKDSIGEATKSPKEESLVAVSDTGVDEGSIDESLTKSELPGAVSDVGDVSKGSMHIFIKTLTGKTITLEPESSDTINKASTDESLKSSKDDLSGAVSEPESDGDVGIQGSEDTGDASDPEFDSDVESRGSEDTEGSLDNEDYYDEQLVEVEEGALLARNYDHLCTNYQEFKAMHLKNIIMENALPYLPAKSLTRFRSVSKAWDMRIQSSFLAHQQSYKFRHLSGYFHERYTGFVSFTSFGKSSYGVPNPYLDFLPVLAKMSVVGASNGLLLCKATEGAFTYFVCNPATKKWKMLPQPRFYHGEKPAIAFAFEPSVLNMEAHYELVCAFPRLDEPVLSLEIYSSLTKEWRSIDSLCSELAKSKLNSSGFYFNGVAYWETDSNEVLAFDINSGIHGVLPLPSGVTAGGALGQMGGEVCYVSAGKLYDRTFEISVYAGMDMDLKGSVQLALGSRWFCGSPEWIDNVEDEEYCRVMPFFTDDKVTLLVDGCFYVCDLNKEMVKAVMPDRNVHVDASYWPYVNSLVCV